MMTKRELFDAIKSLADDKSIQFREESIYDLCLDYFINVAKEEIDYAIDSYAMARDIADAVENVVSDHINDGQVEAILSALRR